ncbi:SLATT domain-containing protein [Vibrio parahaemolyticus]|uniref:SLATT domain-containing protein n=1 Tax=Vibrio parahaemolyticus TaxID=670 RepID=UPI00235EF655|nr:SLATT domain-containing protein [Vibrio parahaemolyticus]
MPNHEKGTADFLESELEKRIMSFGSKRKSYRSRSFFLTFSLSLLSVTVTVLIGLQGVDDVTQNKLLNFALVISGIVTLGTTLDTFLSYKALWIKYTEVVNLLKELKSDLLYVKFKNSGEIPDNETDQFYTRYKKILKEANSHWSNVRTESKKTQSNEE